VENLSFCWNYMDFENWILLMQQVERKKTHIFWYDNKLIWAVFLLKKQEFWELCLSIYTIIFSNKHWSSRESISLTRLYHILGLVENVNIIFRVGPVYYLMWSILSCIVFMFVICIFVGLLLLLLLYSNQSIEPKLDLLSLTHWSPATICLIGPTRKKYSLSIQ
jgi:hypothetical protein